MKRIGIIVALSIALALPTAAAAQTPAEGWQGWTWSSVLERLAGWADGLSSVFGASETTTATTDGTGDETTAPTDDPSLVLTDDGNGHEAEAYPHIDPNG